MRTTPLLPRVYKELKELWQKVFCDSFSVKFIERIYMIMFLQINTPDLLYCIRVVWKYKGSKTNGEREREKKKRDLTMGTFILLAYCVRFRVAAVLLAPFFTE